MKYLKLSLLAACLISSGLFAFAARDLMYSLIVIPLAYVTWQLGVVFHAVPQLIWWVALIVIASLGTAWQLIPEIKLASRGAVASIAPLGQVETVALWLGRARSSTYFRWQIANRLGRVWRRLSAFTATSADGVADDLPVVRFLSAGVDHSFVDFPARRRPFGGPAPTPLDADVAEVVNFLESGLGLEREWHDQDR